MSKTTTEAKITAPNLVQATFTLRGTAPLMTNRFAAKMELLAKHVEGGKAKKGERKAKDVDDLLEKASYIAPQGWFGFHVSGLRTALIDACRLVNYKMTFAKLSIFVDPEAYDKEDGMPIIPIHGEREMSVMTVRTANGMPDVRIRPIWHQWEMQPKITWDADQFTASDVANLLLRVGRQVGIGEGRPYSKDSAGMGFGLFELIVARHNKAKPD
ncbi:MAG: hypothetical protein EBS23_08085 [Betaproteobacteria bacterium]|nr:hypothetical protein [Betaproteobacteria bacterium]